MSNSTINLEPLDIWLDSLTKQLKIWINTAQFMTLQFDILSARVVSQNKQILELTTTISEQDKKIKELENCIQMNNQS